jgi:opacity protein-like surface antigen
MYSFVLARAKSCFMSVKSSFCFIISCLFLLSLSVNAQYDNYGGPQQPINGSSELRLHVGGNAFFGDLGGKTGKGKPFLKDLNTETIRPFAGISYGYYITDWLNVNGGVNGTWVTGADSLIKNASTQRNSDWRYRRNLSFKSIIVEVSGNVELYPLQLLERFSTASLRPYVGAGIGLFHFNPQAKLNGGWVDLNPLHLEGQGFSEYPGRKEYKLTQFYIPVTAGLRYRLNDNFTVSLSTVFRKTFTDYIDDVSNRYINPALFDKYLTGREAALARQLYFRGIASPEELPIGKRRGHSGKDTYTSVFITIGYLFDNYY